MSDAATYNHDRHNTPPTVINSRMEEHARNQFLQVVLLAVHSIYFGIRGHKQSGSTLAGLATRRVGGLFAFLPVKALDMESIQSSCLVLVISESENPPADKLGAFQITITLIFLSGLPPGRVKGVVCLSAYKGDRIRKANSVNTPVLAISGDEKYPLEAS